MSVVHYIRLRGPWGCEPLERFVASNEADATELDRMLPPPGRLVMPSDWLPVCGANFAGRVRFRRRFHWPSPLTPRERLRLVFDEIVGCARVQLNESDLGEIPEGASASFEITQILQPTNVLLVEVTHTPPAQSAAAGGIPGEVRLEVFHA